LVKITVDLATGALSFEVGGKRYRVEGECLRCGKCCEGRCHWLDYEEDGKTAECLLHGRSKPWDCFLYPATHSPNKPLFEGCGYKIVEEK